MSGAGPLYLNGIWPGTQSCLMHNLCALSLWLFILNLFLPSLSLSLSLLARCTWLSRLLSSTVFILDICCRVIMRSGLPLVCLQTLFLWWKHVVSVCSVGMHGLTYRLTSTHNICIFFSPSHRFIMNFAICPTIFHFNMFDSAIW